MFSSVFLSESHNLASHWQVNFDRFISIDPSPLLLQTGSTRGSKKPKSHRLVLDNPFFLMIFVCTSSYLKIETEQSHASKKVYGLMFEIFDWLILQYPLSGGRGVDFQWAHSLLVRLVAIEIFTQTDSNQSLLTYNVWLQHGNVVLQKKKKEGGLNRLHFVGAGSFNGWRHTESVHFSSSLQSMVISHKNEVQAERFKNKYFENKPLWQRVLNDLVKYVEKESNREHKQIKRPTEKIWMRAGTLWRWKKIDLRATSSEHCVIKVCSHILWEALD